jgi:hypothetical protein
MPPFLANVTLKDLKAMILKCTKSPLKQTSKCYMKKYTYNFVITEVDLLTFSTKVVKLAVAEFYQKCGPGFEEAKTKVVSSMVF